MADAVETIECGKAEEFLTSISPRGECFGTRIKASATGIERWLFRGQPESIGPAALCPSYWSALARAPFRRRSLFRMTASN
jgi:hypothetical protein